MTLPISGDLALDLMVCQRASGGSQKTFAARYSSRFSAASLRCGSSLMNHSLLESEKPKSSCSRFSSKASEMYLRKMRPRQTCLYSEASMWPRILSAAAQSWASKLRPESLAFFLLFPFAIVIVDTYYKFFKARQWWSFRVGKGTDGT